MPTSIPNTPKKQTVEHNPYLQSQAIWNDLYGSVQKKLENSYRIIALLSVVIIIAMIGMTTMALQVKVKPVPFILHGEQLFTLSQQQTADFKKLEPSLSLYFAKQFIERSRTVSADGQLNHQHQVGAYALVDGSALKTLRDFYASNKPNEQAKTVVKTLNITSILNETPQSVSLRWKETIKDVHTGQTLKQTPYIAHMTYRYRKPSDNVLELQHNPLGFEIIHLSWTPESHIIGEKRT